MRGARSSSPPGSRRSAFAARRSSCNGVTNLWARRGSARPLVCFAGHTDVVPLAGSSPRRATDLFEPTLRDGYLYGRGAADMKSSIAAFVTAIEGVLLRFVHEHSARAKARSLSSSPPTKKAPPSTAQRGWSSGMAAQGERIDYCVVGEPSSVDTPRRLRSRTGAAARSPER